MPPPSSFLVARVDDHLYVRTIGLANMKSAPMLDAFLRSERAIGVAAMTACIDLSACSGMDSTFMGLLVGSAEAFASAGGRLVVVNPSQANLKLLETLGVTAVVAVVNTCEAPGVEYTALHAATSGSQADRIQVVRRAHQHLMGLSASNRVKFGSFVAALESDLARQATIQSVAVTENALSVSIEIVQSNVKLPLESEGKQATVAADNEPTVQAEQAERIENAEKIAGNDPISTDSQDAPVELLDGGLTKPESTP